MVNPYDLLLAASRKSPPAEFRVDLSEAGADQLTIEAETSLQYPIVELDTATFLWRGEADAVWLRHFMALEEDAFALTREPGSDRWHLRLRVPQQARFEYKFDIVRNGHGKWINDPLNPKLATDPFGGNSVCETWGYVAPKWARQGLAKANGKIKHWNVDSPSFSGKREIGVYLPAAYDASQTYPLVIVHDGYDYVDHASLVPVLDNLIERGDLPPLVAALIQSPDRSVEYVDDPRHVTFVTEELLPALEQRYSLSHDPGDRVLMGASLGAVASLSIAARAPRLFGGVVLKSGSFIFDQKLLATRHELFKRISTFIEGLDRKERMLHRAFVSCGRYEGLVDENWRMAAFLRYAGISTRHVESHDAHHWGNWRDQIRSGLMWCLRPAIIKKSTKINSTRRVKHG